MAVVAAIADRTHSRSHCSRHGHPNVATAARPWPRRAAFARAKPPSSGSRRAAALPAPSHPRPDRVAPPPYPAPSHPRPDRVAPPPYPPSATSSGSRRAAAFPRQLPVRAALPPSGSRFTVTCRCGRYSPCEPPGDLSATADRGTRRRTTAAGSPPAPSERPARTGPAESADRMPIEYRPHWSLTAEGLRPTG